MLGKFGRQTSSLKSLPQFEIDNFLVLPIFLTTTLSHFTVHPHPRPAKSNDEVYVIAKYDYNAAGPQELNLKKNEKLRLIDDSMHW